MERPNILFILADDLGWADLSFHGSPIRTPNIDRIATEGVELVQHYVCPMCTPTRASFLTGRHPGRFGAHATVPSNAPVLPDGYQTLAALLRSSGYDTGLFGKWHLGSSPQYGPNKYGFNTAYGSLAGGIDPYNHRYKRGDFSFTWHRDGELLEETGHVTDLIARETVAWIETRKAPWFCYVPFTAVHIPVKPTQEWLDRYQSEEFDEDPLKDMSFRKYAAYTSHMDYAIGQLVEALERTCQRENTIIVFSSDNGAVDETPLHASDKYPGWQEAYPRLGSNAPFRGVKGQLYEGGIRTPTVVSWRGKLAPGKLAHPVHVVDWSPTFTNLAGATPESDPQWDGIDIWPLISREAQRPPDRCMFWNFRGAADLGFLEGEWKLISRTREGEQTFELFNVTEDPREETELSSQYPDVVKRLSDLMAQQRQLDDSSKRDDVDSPLVG
jgi:arylsulfatase A-like enzyme